MQNQKTILMYAVAALVVLLGGALFYYMVLRTGSTSEGAPGTIITSPGGDVGIDVQGGSATVEEVPSGGPPPAPDYHTPLVFSATESADVRTSLTAKFNAAVATLDKNGTDFQAWMAIGTLRKFVGDYKGAESAWSYGAKLYPKSTVPFDNLGSLYLDFLKDYPKAEVNFKQAIANDAHDINAYQQLFALYTVYGYKSDTSAAASLIAQGLKDNPNNQTLLGYQSQLNAR